MSTKNKKKQEKPKIPPIKIENAKIIWRNFSGEAKKFNAAGLRNFHVVIPPDMAQVLEHDGWNIKWEEPKEEGDKAWAHLKVRVRFDNMPPRIVMITSGGKTILDESTVETLDWAELQNVDLVLSPYFWEVSGKTGITAYLKKMFVTLVEDELEAKYREVTKKSASPDTENDD